jgi:hypothetical protein
MIVLVFQSLLFGIQEEGCDFGIKGTDLFQIKQLETEKQIDK